MILRFSAQTLFSSQASICCTPVQIWLKLFVPFFSREETLKHREIYSRSSFKYLYLACKLFVVIGKMKAKYLPVNGSLTVLI